MVRQFGLLLASTLAAGLIAACSAAADPGGQLNGHAAGYGSGSAGDDTSGDTPATPGVDAGGASSAPPASGGGSPTPVEPPPVSGPGSTASAAHVFFATNVYPTLTTCTGCHATGASGAPKMMETSADITYQELDARGLIISNSLLLTKGTHASGAAPALTTNQQQLVTQWLQLEAGERKGQAAPVNVLAKLGGCLDETLFNGIGLQNLRTVKRTNENANQCTGCNNAPCRVCHTAGDNGFYMALGSNIDNGTFAATKTPQYIVKYFGLNGVDPVASNAVATKATATQTGAPYTHPMFKLTPAQLTAMDAFVNDAITKYKAGTCAATPAATDAGADAAP